MFSALPSGYYSITPFYRGKRETEIQTDREKQTDKQIDKEREGQTDIQIDRYVDRESDERTDKQIEKPTEGQTDEQIKRRVKSVRPTERYCREKGEGDRARQIVRQTNSAASNGPCLKLENRKIGSLQVDKKNYIKERLL